MKAWIKEAAVVQRLKVKSTQAVTLHSRVTPWQRATRKGGHEALVTVPHTKADTSGQSDEDGLRYWL